MLRRWYPSALVLAAGAAQLATLPVWARVATFLPALFGTAIQQRRTDASEARVATLEADNELPLWLREQREQETFGQRADRFPAPRSAAAQARAEGRAKIPHMNLVELYCKTDNLWVANRTVRYWVEVELLGIRSILVEDYAVALAWAEALCQEHGMYLIDRSAKGVPELHEYMLAQRY